jgi:NAD(P)-dependent dehydrogenase (short-subunit alcohol dehydrogenase family)
MEIRGKRVLVTGGGSGIGLGIARALAAEGCRVAICGRNRERLEQAAAAWQGEPGILTRACDVADRQSVRAMFDWIAEQLGGLDILVNSAGVNVARRTFDQLDPADWDKMLGTNASGAFNCLHFALPGMRRQGGGLVVNISSIAGKRASKLAGTGYCASKFAMTALGAAVGLEESENGIHVTNIYPGEVNTPILAERPVPVPPEKRAKMLLPEDIAAMVVALAKLHPRARVHELVMTPLYQEYV